MILGKRYYKKRQTSFKTIGQLRRKGVMENFSLRVNDENGIIEAMDITEQLACKMGFSSYDRLFLRLATEEACSNAYEYCQKTHQSFFYVFWRISKTKLTICVKHEGPMFKVEKRNDVNTGLRGRGLQLILHIMDQVQVEKQEENVLFFMHKYRG